MLRIMIAAAAALLVLGGMAAQTKIAGVEDHAKTMKSNAQMGAAMNRALTEPSYEDARKHLATARQNYLALRAFWSEHKRTDAVEILNDGLRRLDALDKMLVDNADLQTVQQASAAFGRNTCLACHKIYREGDDQTGFRFKPGVLSESSHD